MVFEIRESRTTQIARDLYVHSRYFTHPQICCGVEISSNYHLIRINITSKTLSLSLYLYLLSLSKAVFCNCSRWCRWWRREGSSAVLRPGFENPTTWGPFLAIPGLDRKSDGLGTSSPSLLGRCSVAMPFPAFPVAVPRQRDSTATLIFPCRFSFFFEKLVFFEIWSMKKLALLIID